MLCSLILLFLGKINQMRETEGFLSWTCFAWPGVHDESSWFSLIHIFLVKSMQ